MPIYSHPACPLSLNISILLLSSIVDFWMKLGKKTLSILRLLLVHFVYVVLSYFKDVECLV